MKKRLLRCLAFALGLSFAMLSACGDETPAQSAGSGETSKNGDIVYAEIEMENGGIIKLELYHNIAPITVDNFVSLANKGFYDGLIFHRVISGFMIQGGDPNGNGSGGPGYTIKGEFSANGVENNILHERGVISMARQGHPYFDEQFYDTAGSQFFIMHKDNATLNGKYAAFGRVIEGMDVVDAIASVEVDSNKKPLTEQKIKTIRITG